MPTRYAMHLRAMMVRSVADLHGLPIPSHMIAMEQVTRLFKITCTAAFGARVLGLRQMHKSKLMWCTPAA